MLLAEQREELVRFCRRYAADGLMIGTAGNLSVRSGDLVAITPRSKNYLAVTAELMSILGLDGGLVEGSPTPSSEVPMHLAIYRRTDAGAVVHTHSTYATALGTVVDELPPIHYVIATLGGPVAVAPYATFGSEELAAHVLRALAGRSAALLRNHGAVTVGRTLEEAYDRTLTLEWLCEIYYRARQMGDPSILPLEEIERVGNEMQVTGYPRRSPGSI